MKLWSTPKIFLTTLLLAGFVSAYAQDIVWTETFTGGPNGWTSIAYTPTDTNVWIWDPTGFVGNGALANASWAITSPTGSTGAMVFNGDFYTTLGDPANVPSGPPSSYPKYIADLISPTIDLSAVTSPLSIQYTQMVRFLNVSPGAPGDFRASIAVSTDDGATWSDPIDAVSGKTINTFYNDDTQTIPVPGIEGSSTVRIRFTFSTDFYFWVVDDINLIERIPHDMQANTNFYAIAPNIWTPASQVEEFGFLCDIENVGGEAQTNVILNMTITEDPSGTVVYDEDYNYGTIGVDSLAENVSWGGFTPPAQVASYDATYTVSADSADVNPDNNSISFFFEVSDSTFSKDIDPTRPIYPADDNWDVGEPRSWAYGNCYYVVEGDGWYANTITFSIDTQEDPAAEGQNVQIVLYKWEDANEDGQADFDERDREGTYFYTIDGSEEWDELITVPLSDLATGLTPALDDESYYIATIEFVAEDETRVDFGASDNFDYGGMILGSAQLGSPRYAGMLGINSNLDDEPYSSVGFGSEFVPVVRLNISQSPIFSSDYETLDPANVIQVLPNPASDFVQVQLGLTQISERVEAELININGQRIALRELQNVQNGNVEFDVRNLPAGSYFVRVQTDFGATVKKVVVE